MYSMTCAHDDKMPVNVLKHQEYLYQSRLSKVCLQH